MPRKRMVPPPEPDALEHEGLWSEPDRSTGCEVMRSPGPHGKDGLTFWIQAAKRKRYAEIKGLDLKHPM